MPKKPTDVLPLLQEAVAQLKSIATSLISVAESSREQVELQRQAIAAASTSKRRPVITHIGQAEYATEEINQQTGEAVPGFRRT